MAYRRFIYVAGEPDGGVVKIGRSVSPATRVSELRRPGNAITPHSVDYEKIELLAVWRARNAAERWLHRRFADRRILGEWYGVHISEVRAALEHLPPSYRPEAWEETEPPPLTRLIRGSGGRRTPDEIEKARAAWLELRCRMDAESDEWEQQP